MVNRLLLIMVFILAINTLQCQTSKAENINSQTCSFTKVNSGTLVPENGIQSSRLVSLNRAGGSPTEISVACKQAVDLIISEPTQLAGPPIKPISTSVIVEASSGKSISSDKGSTLPLPVGTTTLLFNLIIDGGKPLPAGNYRYGFKFNVINSD